MGQKALAASLGATWRGRGGAPVSLRRCAGTAVRGARGPGEQLYIGKDRAALLCRSVKFASAQQR